MRKSYGTERPFRPNGKDDKQDTTEDRNGIEVAASSDESRDVEEVDDCRRPASVRGNPTRQKFGSVRHTAQCPDCTEKGTLKITGGSTRAPLKLKFSKCPFCERGQECSLDGGFFSPDNKNSGKHQKQSS